MATINNKERIKAFVIRAILFEITWISYSYVLLWEANKEMASVRQNILFVRSYAFAFLYALILFPMFFFDLINNKKMLILHFFYTSLLITTTYFIIIHFSSHIPVPLKNKFLPNTLLFFAIYQLLFAIIIMIGFCLNSKYSIVVSTLLFLLTTSILWANPILHLEWGQKLFLYSNPLIAISTSFDSYDILRTGKFYELCILGANYPFEYPTYTRYIILYLSILAGLGICKKLGK